MMNVVRSIEELEAWFLDGLSVFGKGHKIRYSVDSETQSFILRLPSTGMKHVVFNKQQLETIPIEKIKKNIITIVQEEICTSSEEIS